MYLIKHEIFYATAIVFSILIQCTRSHALDLIEVFQWKQMDFYNRGDRGLPIETAMLPPNEPSRKNSGAIIFPDQLAYRRPLRNKREPPKVTSRDVNIVNTASRLGDISDTNIESYIPYNNVPMGATHFNGRLFVTMPRRRMGIPSTLNYIDMLTDGNNPSPKLNAYPNFETNYLNPNFKPNPNRLISVYRTSVDACNRLWFIDTGMLEYPGNRTQVQRPSIWVINLLTDSVIRRFEIPQDIAATGQGLASITIDTTSNRCDEAFAYIPDLVNGQLCVYSFWENRIWRFTHNYFNFDPLGGDLFIGGQSFRWDDGIFSITLGPLEPTGFRTALFHAMASTNEFMVSTEVLQNETNSQRSNHGDDFRLAGNRGPKRQSTMHEYDPRTGVVFYAEIQRNGVGCWNTKKLFSPNNHGTVAQDAARMIYPSDLTIDNQGVMWVMTNSMPIYIYSNLDPNVVNFRVWKQKTVDAIKNTICESV